MQSTLCAGVNADMTSRPVSRPHYDPLMDEIFAVKSGEELSRQPLVSPKYVPGQVLPPGQFL